MNTGGVDAAHDPIVNQMQRVGVHIGASVKDVDSKGNTALHLAAEKGKLANLRLLLKKGAKVNAKNKEGKTPLDVATKRGFVRKELKYKGAN